MKRLIEFPFKDDNTIMVLVEEPEIEGEEVPVSGPEGVVKAQQTFEEAVSKIRPVIDRVIAAMEGIPKGPDEFELEFGVSLSGKANIIIAQAGVEANFKVNMTWKKK